MPRKEGGAKKRPAKCGKSANKDSDDEHTTPPRARSPTPPPKDDEEEGLDSPSKNTRAGKVLDLIEEMDSPSKNTRNQQKLLKKLKAAYNNFGKPESKKTFVSSESDELSGAEVAIKKKKTVPAAKEKKGKGKASATGRGKAQAVRPKTMDPARKNIFTSPKPKRSLMDVDTDSDSDANSKRDDPDYTQDTQDLDDEDEDEDEDEAESKKAKRKGKGKGKGKRSQESTAQEHFHLTDEQGQDVADWVKDNSVLYCKKERNYLKAAEKMKMWREKARDMGLIKNRKCYIFINNNYFLSLSQKKVTFLYLIYFV